MRGPTSTRRNAADGSRNTAKLRRTTGLLRLALVLTLSAAGLAHTARAEDIAVDLAGIDITANLELAPGKSLKRHGVVLLVHDTLSHSRNEFISGLQQMLRQRGVNTLAINLSYGLDRRRGEFDCRLEHDHRHADALDEIDAWLRWLKDQKTRKIILAGHARGANQAALFATRITETSRKEPALKGLVLMSPMTGPDGLGRADFNRNSRQPLAVKLEQARKMIAEDEGNIVMPLTGFLRCKQAQVTANAFSDYYAPNPRHDTLNLLPSILVPVLAIAGSLDPSSAALAGKMGQTSDASRQAISIVEGADRNFQGPARETLAESIQAFFAKR